MRSFLRILPIALLLVACGGDPIQKDLLTYVNDGIKPLADLESTAVDAYRSISGDNYQSDSLMYAVITDTVIPTYTDFANKLQAIVPATPEVKTLHNEYVKAAQDNLEAFKLIAVALEKQDASIIEQANADLDKGVTLIDLWKRDLAEACEKHNVELSKPDSTSAQ